MKNWWRAASERERLLVFGAAAVIGLGSLFQLALAPLAKWRSGSDARAEIAEENYRLVTRAAAAAVSARTSDAPVRNALVAAAAELQIPLAFVNALPDGSVDLQTEPAPPEKAFALFARLESEHAIGARTVDIARALDDPDLVRVQATLAR
jgi:type II secretory pathway component PulM